MNDSRNFTRNSVRNNHQKRGRQRNQTVPAKPRAPSNELKWDGNFFAQTYEPNGQMAPQQRHQNAAIRFASHSPPRNNQKTRANYQYNHPQHSSDDSYTQQQSPPRPKGPRPKHRIRRSRTFTNRADIEQILEIPVASTRIRVGSIAPKEAPDIIPKDELTQFLTDYDLRELKYQLRVNQIEYEHLQFVDPNDLNDLCVDLKMSAAQKIRFKFAVKELQHYEEQKKPKQQQSHSVSPPLRYTDHHVQYMEQNPMPLSDAHPPPAGKVTHAPGMFKSQSAAYTHEQQNFRGYTQPTQKNMATIPSPQETHALIQSRTSLQYEEDEEEKLPIMDPQYSTNTMIINNDSNLLMPMHGMQGFTMLPGYISSQTTLVSDSNNSSNHEAPSRFIPPPPPRTRERVQTMMISSSVPLTKKKTKQKQNNNAVHALKPMAISVTSPVHVAPTHRRMRRNSIGTPTMGSGSTHVWSEWHEQWKCLIRESAANKNEISMQSSMNCASITECCCIKRVVYLMRFYMQFKTKGLEITEIIKAISLAEYSVIDLLNDHYHIQSFHRDKDFHYIFEQLKTAGYCSLKQCPMIKRNNLCQYQEYILFYFGLSNIDDVIYIQFLDKMHCSYFHCYDLYRFTPKQNRELQNAVDNNSKVKNRPQNYHLLLHNSYYTMVGNLMEQKKNNLREIRGSYKFAHCQKYSTSLQHVNNEFGYKYMYDKGTDPYGDDCKYIVPLFNDLKQEMLNNRYAAISNKDWTISMRKCQNYYFNSHKMKQFSRKLDVEGMLCLYLFVNLENIPHKFIQTYLDDDGPSKHGAFWHFSCILKNTIARHGLLLENYHFFHGLIGYKNDALNDIYFTLHCPLLTTSRFEVMYNYQCLAMANMNTNSNYGMILTVCSVSSSERHNKFIDTSWFANIECEQSQIFFAASHVSPVRFRIASMIDLHTFSNYCYYLNGIYVLQCILSQEQIECQVTTEIYVAIKILIESVLDAHARINCAREMQSIFRLFCNVCDEQKRIKINMKQMVKTLSKNNFLLNFFVRSSGKGVYVLNIANLQKIYKNMSSLSISSSFLHSTVFAHLLRLYSANSARVIQHLDWNNIRYKAQTKNVYSSMGEAVTAHQDKFESIGCRLEIDAHIDNVLILSKQNYGFTLSATSRITVKIRDPMNDNSMAIDYSNMNINTYQQDLYEIQLKLDNEQLISADITYDDLADLHNWMTRKRKGINALKFKTKLPSDRDASKQKRTEQHNIRQANKVEAYLKQLLHVVLKNENQMFKKHLYRFLVENINN